MKLTKLFFARFTFYQIYSVNIHRCDLPVYCTGNAIKHRSESFPLADCLAFLSFSIYILNKLSFNYMMVTYRHQHIVKLHSRSKLCASAAHSFISLVKHRKGVHSMLVVRVFVFARWGERRIDWGLAFCEFNCKMCRWKIVSILFLI